MKHAVYNQLHPIPTGRKFSYFSPDKGEVVEQEWHALNLKYMGHVETWEEAKKLCRLPVMVEYNPLDLGEGE